MSHQENEEHFKNNFDQKRISNVKRVKIKNVGNFKFGIVYWFKIKSKKKSITTIVLQG